jgi:single-strand DNA-binding protein
MTINKVIIIGNLGQDPEIRKTQDGREIANFSKKIDDKSRRKKRKNRVA